MRALVRLLLLSLTVFAPTACATTGYERTGGDPNVITAEEIQAAEVNNLYQLVERLRPRWLDVRARRSFNSTTQIMVYQGQTLLGGVDMLRQFGKNAAYRLRYLSAAEASATLPGLGSRQVEGAIIINPDR